MTATRDALKARLGSISANRIPQVELLVLKLIAASVMARIDRTRPEREANIRPVQKHVPPPPPGMHLPHAPKALFGFSAPAKKSKKRPKRKVKVSREIRAAELTATDIELFGETPWWQS